MDVYSKSMSQCTLIQQQSPPISYEIVAKYPHNAKSFTQGLFYDDQYLYESVGQYGSSALQKIDINTGTIIQEHRLSNDYFAEGISHYKGHIYLVTWKSGHVFIFNRSNFDLVSTISVEQEMWGAQVYEDLLWVSDGSSQLLVFSLPNLRLEKTLHVHFQNHSIANINELELFNGYFLANIWKEHCLIVIKPETGEVIATIDLSSIVLNEKNASHRAVLNGIAYDRVNDRLFVTGKLWSHLYEIKLKDSGLFKQLKARRK